jgi:uncharacterized membrane protein
MLHKLSHRNNTIAHLFIFVASAYGVFLGRELRLNSWDLVSAPLDVLNMIFESIFNPKWVKQTLSMTFIFTVFLAISNYVFGKIIYLKNE